jgi:Helix-turn-helix domain
MTAGRRHRIDQIPEGTAAIVGVNIRALRQRKGWTQTELGELMGWPNASTVCAAEGRRSGRQRGFTAGEVRQLAAIFGVSSRQLTAQCANCGGHPSAGFACLACGATTQCHSPASKSASRSATRSRTRAEGRMAGLGGCRIGSREDPVQAGKAWPRSP